MGAKSCTTLDGTIFRVPRLSRLCASAHGGSTAFRNALLACLGKASGGWGGLVKTMRPSFLQLQISEFLFEFYNVLCVCIMNVYIYIMSNLDWCRGDTPQTFFWPSLMWKFGVSGSWKVCSTIISIDFQFILNWFESISNWFWIDFNWFWIDFNLLSIWFQLIWIDFKLILNWFQLILNSFQFTFNWFQFTFLFFIWLQCTFHWF